MIKLYYITNIRLPTEKAHGIQIMKTCEAFSEAGTEVELVVPDRKSLIKEDPFEYYGAKKKFKITRLWCLDTVKYGYFGYWIEMITFAEMVMWRSLFKSGVFYTRDEFLAFNLVLMGKKVFWEAHTGQKNFWVKMLIFFKVPIVTISSGLKDLYVKIGVSENNILVSPDGVDMDLFDIKISREEARRRLGLELEKKLAIYTGSDQPGKGVETLKKAKALVQNAEIAIISGKSYEKIPLYMRAADVLVIPNSARTEASRLYTSPMKLFEYMASGTPIIASDLPSLREIIDDSTAFFFTPDDPHSLAEAIKQVLSSDVAEAKAKKSLEKVRQYSWNNRAESILNYINV